MDYLYIYKCKECDKCLFIPMENINEDYDLYGQFRAIINNTPKECHYCENVSYFEELEFPIKYLDEKTKQLIKDNTCFLKNNELVY